MKTIALQLTFMLWCFISYGQAGEEQQLKEQKAMVQKHLKEADSLFYFDGHPINPQIINEFQPWLSDGPIVMSLDLEAGNNSNRYFDTSVVKGTSLNLDYGATFSYEYLGKTQNGIHIVRTTYWGGGTGVFASLLFLSFKIKSFDDNGYNYDQLLMSLEKFYSVGDRSGSKVAINGNTVKIDITERAVDSQSKPTIKHLVLQF